ncbi:MAG: hypothetical protein ACLVCH_09625 [Roseburia inulinivorans]
MKNGKGITMNDKINRGQLVRTYIGEGLAPFKFEYKGYQGIAGNLNEI